MPNDNVKLSDVMSICHPQLFPGDHEPPQHISGEAVTPKRTRQLPLDIAGLPHVRRRDTGLSTEAT